ncbi:ABC transporter substrate-binding protein [Paenarthrobacter ureafaciens]|uniref:ABC transporter substrate-binding protein n=1 Tax=Paenarthrobacter ureafaciens TaxID=37931 RepID=UPI001FB2E8C4|nr:ABC transporter substrate-binding protein [Paenarthrobacter ureafaciens]UOD82909.1 ABC transporter substrate-binding protein [Paenarthrobacter ureafaciens]WNZ02616.1 ABC transporter substrate-binding protein [Paenarthrobacter ureafaciens]
MQGRSTFMAAAAAATAAAFLLTGCTTGGQAPAGSTDGGGMSTDTIRTALNADPTTFNAAKANAKDDYEVARFLFDTVVRRDADGKFIGGLATEWKSTATNATLTIRKDATCADGTPITPSIVAKSLNYFADPATKNNFGKLVFGPGQPTITGDDTAGTVDIKLAQPWSELIGGLTLAQTGIICPAGLADLEGLAKGTVKGAFSGPYTLTKSSHGVSYDMTLREDYDAWPRYSKPLEGVPAKTVRFFPGVNKTTVANQLLTGEMDVSDIAPADVQRFEGNKDYTVTSVPFAGIFLLFNQREGSPFTDPALRKAVAQLMNQQAFNAAAYAGKGITYNSIVAPTVPCVLPDNSSMTKEDADAAKAVLAGKTFKMVGTTSIGPNGAGSTYVQEALRAAGATVDLQLVDNGTWATMTQTKPETWDLTVQGDANFVGTVAASLTRIAGVPTEKGGRNIGGGENADILAEIATAQSATDEAARCEAYTKAQKSILSDNDIVPFVGEPQIVAQRSGFSIQAPSGIVDYATLRITK